MPEKRKPTSQPGVEVILLCDTDTGTCRITAVELFTGWSRDWQYDTWVRSVASYGAAILGVPHIDFDSVQTAIEFVDSQIIVESSPPQLRYRVTNGHSLAAIQL